MNEWQPRFDEERRVYRDCPWCLGLGCLQCKAEAEKAYKLAFPNGPEPEAVIAFNAQEGESKLQAALRVVIGEVLDGSPHSSPAS